MMGCENERVCFAKCRTDCDLRIIFLEEMKIGRVKNDKRWIG